MKASLPMVTSYRVGILGYGAGMTLSLFDEVPVGLVFIVATSLVAAGLFLYHVIGPPRAS